MFRPQRQVAGLACPRIPSVNLPHHFPSAPCPHHQTYDHRNLFLFLFSFFPLIFVQLTPPPACSKGSPWCRGSDSGVHKRPGKKSRGLGTRTGKMRHSIVNMENIQKWCDFVTNGNLRNFYITLPLLTDISGHRYAHHCFTSTIVIKPAT